MTSSLSSKLGGEVVDEGLEIKEVGDENLKFVSIVIGKAGSFVIEQALLYIRCIGESWPMTKERAVAEFCWNVELCRLTKQHGMPKGLKNVKMGFDGDRMLVDGAELWEYLKSFSQGCIDPWLVVDDFTVFFRQDEKIGHEELAVEPCTDLADCMASCGLEDLW
ncbi:hypothetical protein Droror1_Dr00019926 [Drosera rotundifolia]